MTFASHPTITIVSAGLWTPSKTTNLALAIAGEVQDRLGGHQILVEIGPIAADLGATLSKEAASLPVRTALAAVENADILIAATPVFRGSFTGHFKHLFDLIQQDALRSVPVILAATGGGEKHCLVLEYSLRPLFGFFQAFAVPTGVYATEKDFDNAVVSSPLVHGRITQAAQEAAHVYLGRQDSARSTLTTSTRVHSA